MLAEILLSMAIMIALLMGGALSYDISPIETAPTVVGILALQGKFDAIRQSKQHTVSFRNHSILPSHHSWTSCQLIFLFNGNSSKATTCKCDHKKLTLRPGEGGIGYPW